MRIELLGTSFNIQTDEDPQYVQDLVDYLRTKVQEVQARIPNADPLKVAIVSGVLTADELFKARSGGSSSGTPERPAGGEAPGATGAAPQPDSASQEEAGRIAQRLIEALDQSLEES